MTQRQIEHREYLKSFRWKVIRSARRMWDRNECRTCHERSNLQVHHASYRWCNKDRWLWWIGAVIFVLALMAHSFAALVIGTLLLNVGVLFEWMDCITLCDVCHKAVQDAHKISDFSD